MTLAVIILSSFAAGLIVGACAAVQIGKRKASSRRDLAAELRSPVDVYPSEFSAHWEPRP